jgi:hypothetical protein
MPRIGAYIRVHCKHKTRDESREFEGIVMSVRVIRGHPCVRLHNDHKHMFQWAAMKWKERRLVELRRVERRQEVHA